jgi:predicted nucleic acid-binding protein
MVHQRGQGREAFRRRRHQRRRARSIGGEGPGFVAGRAFVEYRRRGGMRTSPLPDFTIGAHAAVAGLTLLTRDARRYAGYIPKVELIAPD